MNESVLAALGREVLYLAAAPGSVEFSITGILEAPTQDTRTTDGPFLVLFLQLSDLAIAPTRNDRITVDGTIYKVFEIEADQAGGVRLGLHRQ